MTTTVHQCPTTLREARMQLGDVLARLARPESSEREMLLEVTEVLALLVGRIEKIESRLGGLEP